MRAHGRKAGGHSARHNGLRVRLSRSMDGTLRSRDAVQRLWAALQLASIPGDSGRAELSPPA